MNLKIIMVNNPHDAGSNQEREQFLRRWTPDGRLTALLEAAQNGEVIAEDGVDQFARVTEIYEADFERLREVLPISHVPCYFLCFPEVRTVADVERAIAAVKREFKTQQ